MKHKRSITRWGALALCLALLLSFSMPAMAASYSHIGVVGSSGASIYQNANTASSVMASVNAGQALAIDGQSGSFYRVVLQPSASTSSNGWVLQAAIASLTTASGSKVSSSSASSTASINTSSTSGSGSSNETTASSSGTPGYITNCNSYVNFRSAASASSTKLGTLSKNTVVSILGTEGSFYQVTANGQTGYVSTQYVAAGTPTTASSASSSSSSGSDATVATGTASASSHVTTQMAAAKKINSDVVGYVYLPGTNIDFPVLHNSSSVHYYSSRNINKQSDSKGSIYTFYNVLTRNNVITGHNMRTSGTMFHELHHIQEKTLGYSTCQVSKSTDCQRCSRVISSSVPDLKTAANRIWQIPLYGYNQWEVWAMYEVKANEPSSTLSYNTQHLATSSASTIQTWINTQKSRSEVDFGTSVSTNDVFLTIYTCGTNYDSSTANSRLYFFLKAVG